MKSPSSGKPLRGFFTGYGAAGHGGICLKPLAIGTPFKSSFNEWSRKEKLMAIFTALVVEPDLEWEFIDGSMVKAHPHSSGAAYGQEAAIGKSVAGNTTKIHLAVDACSLPLHFLVTGGEVHDCKEAPTLVAELPDADYIIR